MTEQFDFKPDSASNQEQKKTQETTEIFNNTAQRLVESLNATSEMAQKVTISNPDVYTDPNMSFRLVETQEIHDSEEDVGFHKNLGLVRKDGSYVYLLEHKLLGEENTPVDVSCSVENVSTNEKGQVIAKIIFNNGNMEEVNLGLEKFPEVHMVYRTNESYEGLSARVLKAINSTPGNPTAIDIHKVIFPSDSQIIEDERISSIPENVIIFTDFAAIEACPSLKNKKHLIRLDEQMPQSIESFEDQMKLISNRNMEGKIPKKIILFGIKLAEHTHDLPKTEDRIKTHDLPAMINLLKEKFGNIYPGVEVKVIDYVSDFKEEYYDDDGFENLYVLDRHVKNLNNTVLNMAYSISLKLPLYENKYEEYQEYQYGKNIGKEFLKVIAETNS